MSSLPNSLSYGELSSSQVGEFVHANPEVLAALENGESGGGVSVIVRVR